MYICYTYIYYQYMCYIIHTMCIYVYIHTYSLSRKLILMAHGIAKGPKRIVIRTICAVGSGGVRWGGVRFLAVVISCYCWKVFVGFV